MLTVGVVRIGALLTAGQSIEGVVRETLQWSRAGLAPNLPPWLLLMNAAMPVVSIAVLWFSAPFISRLAFPMPAGRHQCPKCRYPVKDLDADACPECGTRIK